MAAPSNDLLHDLISAQNVCTHSYTPPYVGQESL